MTRLHASSWHVSAFVGAVFTAAVASYMVGSEAPVGAVAGVVIGERSGRPLANAQVYLRPVGPPGRGHVSLRTDAQGHFGPRRIVAGDYSISAHSRAHELPATTATVLEGKLADLSLELLKKPSYLNLTVHQHVCQTTEPATILCDGLLVDGQMTARIYAVDPRQLLVTSEGDLGEWVRQAQKRSPEGVASDERFRLTKTEAVTVLGRDAEGIFQQRVMLPLPGPGLYLVTLSADGLTQSEWILSTDLGLIVKHDGSRMLAYAVNLGTGKPRPEAIVSVYKGQTVASEGRTGPDGLTQLETPSGVSYEDVLILASYGESLAVARTWLWEREARGLVMYACTDRPVYRPGDMVRFRAILREADGDTYRVPADEPVSLKIRDPRNTLIYRQQLRTNEYGSINGTVKLNHFAPTGYYYATAEVKGRPQEFGFDVAEYRKPEYEVTVSSDKERYVRGDTARVSVAAQYYFGTPVPGAEVDYMVYSSPHWVNPAQEDDDYGDEDWYEEEGYYGYGEVVAEGTARTDDQGTAHLNIPTGVKDTEGDHDWRLTVRANVTGPGRQTVDAEGSLIVTRGEYALSVESSRWSARPGQAVDVSIRAVDYEGRPVANADVTVALQHERWQEGEVSSTVVAQQSVRTDGKGKASAKLTPPEEGSFVIVATSKDSRGNLIRDRDHLWVTDRTYASFDYKYPEMELVTDKRRYDAGDTARVLVNTKASGATALVSIEGPQLRDWFLAELKGNSTMLKIPLTTEHIPNVYVSVSYVKGKEFVTRQKQLRVSDKPVRLTVQVDTDKREYVPGAPVSCRIRTLDPQGNPTPAEVSLGVVDESIYAIRQDRADDIVDTFYGRRRNSVETDYSFPPIYLGAGDKGGPLGRVRKRFPDTALWLPEVRTDAGGEAQVDFEIPDTLTSWRFTARACTLSTLVGAAVEKVTCRKKLMARIQTARFFVRGDEAALAGVVHNETKSRLKVSADLHAPNMATVRAPNLAMTLAPSSLGRLDWRLRPEKVGPQTLRLSVAAERLSDALERQVPVLPRGRERVEFRSGVVKRSAVEALDIRQDALPDTAELRVRLTSSITSSIWDSLEYLAQYPWGCVEQTMSSFLPDVVISRAVTQMGLPAPHADLPDMVRSGLDRIYGYQQDGGGWGWWRYDEPDPWMTAYVLFGLLHAREAGFEINQSVLESGLGRLSALAAEGQIKPEQEAFATYVLAKAGQAKGAEELLGKLSKRKGKPSAYSLAWLALAQVQLGRSEQAQQTYVSLWQAAVESEGLCHWPGPKGRYMPDTEVTAVALKACLALRPNDERLAKVVRWLMTRRWGRHWVSTRDTAFILYAVADFVGVSQELRPEFTAKVTLNDKPIGQGSWLTPEDALKPETVLVVHAKDLKPGENRLQLQKAGKGTLYYSVRLGQYLAHEGAPQVMTGTGLGVTREYHRLRLREDRHTGIFELQPDDRPTTRFSEGDLVRVSVDLKTDRDLEYMMLQVPLPAGAEVIERGDLYPWEWSYWYSDMQIRDEKVAFFARHLPQGTHTMQYDMRLELPGKYHALPPHVSCMYEPEVRATGLPADIEVSP